jgi:hypothetical protein
MYFFSGIVYFVESNCHPNAEQRFRFNRNPSIKQTESPNFIIRKERMRKLISFGFSVQSRGFLTFKVKLPSSVCSQRLHKHSFSPSHVLKQQFRRHKSSFRGEEEDECVNKMKKELYANMTAEETEKLYEEIYKPGYIDDMLDRNYIPIPFGKLEILNPEAAMLFDMFKDRPLHPADKEQYPIPRELSKCVEAFLITRNNT